MISNSVTLAFINCDFLFKEKLPLKLLFLAFLFIHPLPLQVNYFSTSLGSSIVSFGVISKYVGIFDPLFLLLVSAPYLFYLTVYPVSPPRAGRGDLPHPPSQLPS